MRLSTTQGFIVAKMQDGYTLKFARKPYQSALFSPEGGQHRNVPNATIKQLLKKRLIKREIVSTTWFITYTLTQAGADE